MNTYLDLRRIEFVMTFNCTGRCKHCSVGEEVEINDGSHVRYGRLSGMLKELSDVYLLDSVMCFGGEPLLYPDDVCGIMREAARCGIPRRQIITNGYFSRDKARIKVIAQALKDAGVTQVLLSVDTFHQETISIDYVHAFAHEMTKGNVDISLQPAWVVHEQADNRYNSETRKILRHFSDLPVQIAKGNDIAPEGNAAVNLGDYYNDCAVNLDQKCGEATYSDNLDKVRTLSIYPNGDIRVCNFVIGNAYREKIKEVIERYDPYRNVMMSALLRDGLTGLIELARNNNIAVKTEAHYLACSVCKEIVNKFKISGKI